MRVWHFLRENLRSTYEWANQPTAGQLNMDMHLRETHIKVWKYYPKNSCCLSFKTKTTLTFVAALLRLLNIFRYLLINARCVLNHNVKQDSVKSPLKGVVQNINVYFYIYSSARELYTLYDKISCEWMFIAIRNIYIYSTQLKNTIIATSCDNVLRFSMFRALIWRKTHTKKQ